MRNRVSLRAIALALAPFAWAQDGFAQGAASVAPMRAQAAYASRPAPSALRPSQVAAQPTRVYLLRGLLDVWSYGMDDLANKLRAVGVEAVVVNHSAWPEIARTLVQQRASGAYTGPIVLVGHSLGGDDVVRAAQALGAAGVAVDLLMPVDPVTPLEVPANVKRAINFYQANNGWGVPLRPAAGFHGAFTNADLESNRRDLREVNTGHASIDKGPKVHAEIIREVLRLRAPRTATRAKRHARRSHQHAAAPLVGAATVSAAATE
jgi:hypothetical protein